MSREGKVIQGLHVRDNMTVSHHKEALENKAMRPREVLKKNLTVSHLAGGLSQQGSNPGSSGEQKPQGGSNQGGSSDKK
jgi:hypothetical protein